MEQRLWINDRTSGYMDVLGPKLDKHPKSAHLLHTLRACEPAINICLCLDIFSYFSLNFYPYPNFFLLQSNLGSGAARAAARVVRRMAALMVTGGLTAVQEARKAF